MIPNKTEHFVTVFNDQVVTVNKGWLYGLTKLKQLSLAHNQVCPLLLQQDALALPSATDNDFSFKVDYIEDDGWDFCSALWQLNLQGNQV